MIEEVFHSYMAQEQEHDLEGHECCGGHGHHHDHEGHECCGGHDKKHECNGEHGCDCEN
ncbi:MAG: hypothetical protein ACK5LC_06060 [Coprobacillaceae bacterium]